MLNSSSSLRAKSGSHAPVVIFLRAEGRILGVLILDCRFSGEVICEDLRSMVIPLAVVSCWFV